MPRRTALIPSDPLTFLKSPPRRGGTLLCGPCQAATLPASFQRNRRAAEFRGPRSGESSCQAHPRRPGGHCRRSARWPSSAPPPPARPAWPRPCWRRPARSPRRVALERGSTVSDHDPLERRMQHSLNAALMHLEHDDTRVHFIDTPGGPDFLGQSLPALEAVETAAVVINAAVGIEPMTLRMMDYAASRHLDRLIVVNRIDAPDVDLAALLDADPGHVRPGVPAGEPARRRRHARRRLLLQPRGPQRLRQRRRRAPRAGRAGGRRRRRLARPLPQRRRRRRAAELHAPLEQALREGHLIPVCFVSARSGAGVAELLDIIVKLLPNPTEANPPDFLNGEGEAAVPMHADPDPAKHVLAHVFKVTVDPYVGRMGIFRVHQGTVTHGQPALRRRRAASPSRWARLFCCRARTCGGAQRGAGRHRARVAKVDDIALRRRAARRRRGRPHPPPPAGRFRTPVHGLAMRPKRHGDEQRMWEILTKLDRRRPVPEGRARPLTTTRPIVYGLGELHLRVLLERGCARLQVRGRHAAAAHCLPRDDHAPTPTVTTGTRSRPAAPGNSAKCSCASSRCRAATASSSSTRSRAARSPASSSRRSRRACARCWPAARSPASRWSDVRVTVYDGKHHPVDSKEIAFVTAGTQGLPRRRPRGAADRAGTDRAHRDHGPGQRDGRHRRRPGVAARLSSTAPPTARRAR